MAGLSSLLRGFWPFIVLLVIFYISRQRGDYLAKFDLALGRFAVTLILPRLKQVSRPMSNISPQNANGCRIL